jgi:putative oxidoreductase
MFNLPKEATWRQWAPLPLRLVIGYGFMAHGWAKLSRGPEGIANLLEQIGAPLPEATAWVSTLVEILGGLAILAGTFVAVVSIPLIVMMLVAMFTVHLRYGFSAINTIGLTADGPQFGPPGYEVNLLYIAGLLALILGGAGPFSIDDCSHEESEGRRPHHLEPAAERAGQQRSAAPSRVAWGLPGWLVVIKIISLPSQGFERQPAYQR